MNRSALCCAFMGLLLILTGACQQAKEAPTAMAIPIMVAPVEARDIAETIQIAGDILAREEASIASEGSGQVTAIPVREGEAVQVGQVVVEIDRERRQLEFESQRARAVETRESKFEQEREAARLRSLYKRHVASKAQLDEAETAFRKANSRFQAATAQSGLAERALRDAEVRAPFDGIIARRFVSPGDFVQTGEKLFDLVALDPVEVEFYLRERDTSRVKIGDPIQVRVAPYPGKRFEAKVSMISPRIDQRTRTLRVKALLPNPKAILRPGLFAEVELGVDRRSDVRMVPEDAVIKRAHRTVLYRLAPGADRVEEVTVRTGAYHDDFIEIIDGVELGDRIVVRGQARLVNGARVVVRERDGSPVSAPVADSKPVAGQAQ